jgi:drug/metabolite transporter (DMT)-like permease
VTGALALVLAATSFACAIVYARGRLQTVPPAVLAFGQVGLALPMAIVMSLSTERPWEVELTLQLLVTVALLGIFASGIAFVIWYRLLDRWDATRASMVAYVQPVVGLALGFLVLDEGLDGSILVGGPLVLLGIYLVNRPSGRALKAGSAPTATGPA